MHQLPLERSGLLPSIARRDILQVASFFFLSVQEWGLGLVGPQLWTPIFAAEQVVNGESGVFHLFSCREQRDTDLEAEASAHLH